MQSQICPHCKKEFIPNHTPCTYCCKKCQMIGLKNKRIENENVRKELGLPRNGYISPYKDEKSVAAFHKKIE